MKDPTAREYRTHLQRRAIIRWMENSDQPCEHPGPAMQVMVVEFIPGGAKLRKNVMGPTSWTGVVGASPDEAAAGDVGGPTGLGWTRAP